MLKALVKIVGGLLVVAGLVLGGLLLKASGGLGRVRDLPARPIAVVADSATLARGRHLATIIMKCVDCHGADFGGKDPFAEAGPLGTVTASNLTTGQGGVLAGYDDPTLARAIRHGIKRDGRPILIMPAGAYLTASDQDVAAVIGYLRSLPPVNRIIAPSRVRPLGRLLYAVGKFPVVEADWIDHAVAPSPAMTPAPTVEYGRYLAAIGGCTGCHGPGLSGGKIPGTPPDWIPATNITPEGLKGWTEESFVKALKTGVRPNGFPIDTLMPWKVAGQMDSTEMAALWAFLQSVPPRKYGGR